MKIDRYGQAKILTPEEIQLLFTEGLTNPRDRALFGICLYAAARIREACSLRTADVYSRIPVTEQLCSLLIDYFIKKRIKTLGDCHSK